MPSTSVKYNENAIVPAPFVSISKSFSRTGDNQKWGAGFDITLTGSLLPNRGSPNTSGEFSDEPTDDELFDNMGQLMAKMDHLRSLFSRDGLLLEINPCSESGTPWTCYPIVIGPIQFQDGNWVNKVDYTINLRTNIISGLYGGLGEDSGLFELYGAYLESATETWNVEHGESYTINTESGLVNTFVVNHNVNAVGQRVYESGELLNEYEPWMWARDYVNLVISSGNSFDDFLTASGSLNVNVSGLDYIGYNHTRTVSVDKTAGSYGVIESWVAAPSGFALEDYTITYETGIDEGLARFNIEGTVTGLEVKTYEPNASIVVSKYDNAYAYFIASVSPNIVDRLAVLFDADEINSTPRTNTVGHNKVTGIINYNYVFDNRPENCISGVRLENITISDDLATDIFSEVIIPGRALGPILDGLGTISSMARTLDIELLLNPVSGCDVFSFQAAFPDVYGEVTAIISGVRPTADRVFLRQHRETYSPRDARFSATVSWSFVECD